MKALIRAFAGMTIVFFTAGCQHEMESQQKAKAFGESDFFADSRVVRQPVEGTVARGQLNDDSLLYTGKINGQPADEFPFPVTAEVLRRGRERYDIYCSVCHDRSGSGEGMIVRRGFPRPPSYHTDRLRQAPAGHFFDVITNGFGRMYPYRDRISPRDRWAIVAYIRALQLSQNAPVNAVPASERAHIEQPLQSTTTAAGS